MNDIKTELKKLTSITSRDVVSVAAIRAIRAKSNDKLEVAKGLLYKSFTPIKNQNKLKNGAAPFQSLEQSITCIVQWLRWKKESVFGYEILTDAEKQQFVDLMNQLKKEKWDDIVYSYIAVRKDLSTEQQIVQTSHCTMVLGQTVNKLDHDAAELHFVIFGAENYDDLKNKVDELERRGVKLVKFFETDLKTNQLTAFACLPMRKSIAQRKKLFVNYDLLKH
jgi:hypothetical protein